MTFDRRIQRYIIVPYSNNRNMAKFGKHYFISATIGEYQTLHTVGGLGGCSANSRAVLIVLAGKIEFWREKSANFLSDDARIVQ